MKQKLTALKLLMTTFLLSTTIAFSQNKSSGSVSSTITPAAPSPIGGTETFRFKTGIVTQLENQGAALFGSTALDQWHGMGRINLTSQTITGFNAQRAGRNLQLGFDGALQTGSTPTLGTSIIQWGGNNTLSPSVAPGNLDFRATLNPNAAPKQIFRMKPDGKLVGGPSEVSSTLFPANYILNINADSSLSGAYTRINSNANGEKYGYVAEITTTNNYQCAGVIGFSQMTLNQTGQSIGVAGYGFGGQTGIGVYGETDGTAFNANFGVWGLASSTAANNFAGYFSGNVFTTASYLPSDKKLKNTINPEREVINKIMLLNPVTYNYTESSIKELNMPQKFQHGFLAQEIEQLFPEMVTEISAPVLEEKRKNATIRKIKRIENLKSINYTMLIPLLTKAIQEQQQTIEELKNEMTELKNNQLQPKNSVAGYTLTQNIPNPFTDNTIINYTLPQYTEKAILMVTDLNGRMLLQYNLTKGSKQQIINGGKLNAGIYVYSLIVNGNEVISKRMVLTK